MNNSQKIKLFEVIKWMAWLLFDIAIFLFVCITFLKYTSILLGIFVIVMLSMMFALCLVIHSKIDSIIKDFQKN